MAALRRARARGGAVQGRARLHRPRLPRPRRRAAGPQPGPGAGRRAPDRAAVPARGGGRRHGRRRGRDGPVRRRGWPTGTARPRTSPGCCGRRWCWWSTAAAQSRSRSRRWCTGSRRSTPRCGSAGWCSTGSAATGTRRCCAPPATRSGCRCSGVLPRRAELAVPSRHSGWCRRPSTGRRPRRRSRRWPSWWRRTSTSTRWSRLAEPILRARPGTRRRSSRGRRCTAARCAERSVAGATRRPVVAVAGGAAFTFGYAEHAELLAAAGPRSPSSTRCTTSACPTARPALVLRGGFPEVYVAALSANEPLRARRRRPRRVRRAGARRVRRAAVPLRRPRRPPDVRCAAGDRRHDRAG